MACCIFLLVSDDIKNWLCTSVEDADFNSLLSLLLNINITTVYQKYTQHKTPEEVKAELLYEWAVSELI